MIQLTLPYQVSSNRYWVAVTIPGKSPGRTRTLMVPSKEAKAYKEQCGWLAKAAGLSKPLEWRFSMEIDLYPALPQDWQRRARADAYWDDDVRCMDLGNCEKVLADALQGIVYTDDRWVWEERKRRMAPDHKGARVEVRIQPHVRERAALMQEQGALV